MQAEPASKGELRRIKGACYGAEDKRAEVASVSEQPATVNDDSPVEALQTKTVPAMQLYYIESKLPMAEVAGELKSIAMRMNIALVRAQGTADGPLHVIANSSDSGEDAIQIAFPVRGLPSGRGQYKTRRSQGFKCLYLTYRGPGSALADAWAGFAQAAQAQGYTLSGQSRMLVNTGGAEPDTVNVELQLGVQ